MADFEALAGLLRIDGRAHDGGGDHPFRNTTISSNPSLVKSPATTDNS